MVLGFFMPRGRASADECAVQFAACHPLQRSAHLTCPHGVKRGDFHAFPEHHAPTQSMRAHTSLARPG